MLLSAEWRSHADTVELVDLLRAGLDETEQQCESGNDAETASSDSEQLDDSDAAAAADADDDEVPFTGLSSKNPFELLADDD